MPHKYQGDLNYYQECIGKYQAIIDENIIIKDMFQKAYNAYDDSDFAFAKSTEAKPLISCFTQNGLEVDILAFTRLFEGLPYVRQNSTTFIAGHVFFTIEYGYSIDDFGSDLTRDIRVIVRQIEETLERITNL